MGPTAGIGDSFFFNCYRVIIAGLCIGLSANGSLLGVILFVLLYGGLLLVYKYIFLTAGYRYGTSLITEAFERGHRSADYRSRGHPRRDYGRCADCPERFN